MISRLLQPRMFTRVLAHGAWLVVTVAVVFVVVGGLFIAPELDRRMQEMAGWMGTSLCNAGLEDAPANAGPGAPAALLDFPIPGTLYEGQRALASNVTPPLPAQNDLPRSVAGRRERGSRDFGFACAATSRHPGAQAVVRLPMPDPPSRMLFVIALAAVSLLIPLSIPLARSVTRPLEDLAVAARALGEGGASKRLDFTRQDEIGDLGRAFDDMATRIAQLRRAEKELLANVSHELRTPIARLRVVLAIIEEDVARAQTYLPELATDLSELERLVDEILVAARLALEKGDFVESTLPLRPEPVAMESVFEAVVERFRSLTKDQALVVDCRVGEVLIEADKVLLRRAIDNLVDNAHKYGASESPIELRGSREGDAVVIDVVDRGRGIPQSELSLVFTPFYRADPSRTRATGGVGLGLPLAKRIVEAHGGTLTLVSVEGQGTTVRIRIPALPAAAA